MLHRKLRRCFRFFFGTFTHDRASSYGNVDKLRDEIYRNGKNITQSFKAPESFQENSS
jgi:hypothetical protein